MFELESVLRARFLDFLNMGIWRDAKLSCCCFPSIVCLCSVTSFTFGFLFLQDLLGRDEGILVVARLPLIAVLSWPFPTSAGQCSEPESKLNHEDLLPPSFPRLLKPSSKEGMFFPGIWRLPWEWTLVLGSQLLSSQSAVVGPSCEQSKEIVCQSQTYQNLE